MVTTMTRILLVEDNPADADLIRERLDSQEDLPPYAIDHVVSLRMALDKLADGGIDLILLDLGLPDSHGLPTVTHVIQHAPAVPVVVISGFDDPEVRRQAMDASARDFMAKDALDGQRLADYVRGAHAPESSPRVRRAAGTAPMVIRKILVFEPDEGMFVATATMLHLVGYETTRATSFMDVVSQAETGYADVIVVGLGSGIDEHHLIERINSVTATPIIALTPPDRVPGAERPKGVEEWLSKPASGQTLQAAIGRIGRGAETDVVADASSV